jgi:glycosyltransferase involved in cell wall biosynthesis
MPAYNAANYISVSIESVIHQSFSNWELLIVDDGSTDDTKNIVKNYIEADKRIKYLWQPNGRQGKARNLGLQHAKGTLIAFLDADDLWLPGKLDAQVRELSIHKVDAVFSNYYIFRSPDLSDKVLQKTCVGRFSGKEAVKAMLQLNQIPILTVLVKAEAIKDVNGFIEDKEVQNAEDYHLWMKLLMKGYIFFGMIDALAAYREHSAASTTSDKFATQQSITALFRLGYSYPVYRNLIRQSIKSWFKRFYYSVDNIEYDLFKQILVSNCQYVGKPGFANFFLSLYRAFGYRLSRKIISKVLN